MNTKNIKFIFLIITLLGGNLIKSQNIIVWGADNGNLPANFMNSGAYYYKDIHNYLDNFIGTWEYVNGNEKFQVTFTKIIKYHSFDNELHYNFYEDGITFQYKKYKGNLLIYSSPTLHEPTFKTAEGIKLDGLFIDYGRITKEVKWPPYVGPPMAGTIYRQGGEYFHPSCTIEKNSSGTLTKIKFHLYLRGANAGFGSPYDNPIYAGQPRFSIPNDIILTKIP